MSVEHDSPSGERSSARGKRRGVLAQLSWMPERRARKAGSTEEEIRKAVERLRSADDSFSSSKSDPVFADVDPETGEFSLVLPFNIQVKMKASGRFDGPVAAATAAAVMLIAIIAPVAVVAFVLSGIHAGPVWITIGVLGTFVTGAAVCLMVLKLSIRRRV